MRAPVTQRRQSYVAVIDETADFVLIENSRLIRDDSLALQQERSGIRQRDQRIQKGEYQAQEKIAADRPADGVVGDMRCLQDLAQNDDIRENQKAQPAQRDHRQENDVEMECEHQPSAGEGRNGQGAGDFEFAPAGKNVQHRHQQQRKEDAGQHPCRFIVDEEGRNRRKQSIAMRRIVNRPGRLSVSSAWSSVAAARSRA